MEIPLISVIVPTYNRCHWLGGALESLFRQETGGDFSFEIVVVDNASSDATKETVERVAADAPVPVASLSRDSRRRPCSQLRFGRGERGIVRVSGRR